MGRVGDCDEPIWLLHAEQGAAAKGHADAVGRFREPGPATALASTPKYGARSCFLTSGRDSASPLTVDIFRRPRFGLAGYCLKLAAFVSDTSRQVAIDARGGNAGHLTPLFSTVDQTFLIFGMSPWRSSNFSLGLFAQFPRAGGMNNGTV